MTALRDLEDRIRACTRCNLGYLRNRAVPGRGTQGSPLLIVGEAPGAQEDLEGIPFCGPAGTLLDSLMRVARIDPDLCYITNVVKCRPRGNELPSPAQVAACSGFLDALVGIVRPRALVLLGRCAVSAVGGAAGGIEEVARSGALRTRWGIPARAAYHPSYLLRVLDENPAEFRRLLVFQVETLRTAAGEAGIRPREPVHAQDDPDRGPPQNQLGAQLRQVVPEQPQVAGLALDPGPDHVLAE